MCILRNVPLAKEVHLRSGWVGGWVLLCGPDRVTSHVALDLSLQG